MALLLALKKKKQETEFIYVSREKKVVPSSRTLNICICAQTEKQFSHKDTPLLISSIWLGSAELFCSFDSWPKCV